MNLEIGRPYTCITASGAKVTPIHILSDNKAIFVTDTFTSTPFVEWYYILNPDDTISVASGIYYKSLHRALRGSLPEFSIILSIVKQCTVCGHKHTTDVQLSQDLNSASIVEAIEDTHPCYNCGTTKTKIVRMSIVDDYEESEYVILDD